MIRDLNQIKCIFVFLNDAYIGKVIKFILTYAVNRFKYVLGICEQQSKYHFASYLLLG